MPYKGIRGGFRQASDGWAVACPIPDGLVRCGKRSRTSLRRPDATQSFGRLILNDGAVYFVLHTLTAATSRNSARRIVLNLTGLQTRKSTVTHRSTCKIEHSEAGARNDSGKQHAPAGRLNCSGGDLSAIVIWLARRVRKDLTYGADAISTMPVRSVCNSDTHLTLGMVYC